MQHMAPVWTELVHILMQKRVVMICLICYYEELIRLK